MNLLSLFVWILLIIYQELSVSWCCLSKVDLSDCPPRPTPSHSRWFCLSHRHQLICSLECDPGYAPANRSVTTCREGSWSFPPDSMACMPAWVLITGDWSISDSVELYSSNGSCRPYIYSPPNLRDKRAGHTLDYVDGHIILCGGVYSNTDTTCLELTRAFTWTVHSRLATSRVHHNSVVTAGQLTLIGGDSLSSSNSSSSTEHMSPSMSNFWKPGYNLLQKTSHSCTVKISGDSFMVIGGEDDRGQVVQYSALDGTSTRLQNLQNRRIDHGCILVKNETFRGVLVTGGQYKLNYLRKSEMYDLEQGDWREVGLLKTGRSGHRMAVVKNKILAMGGIDRNLDSLFSVEQFSLKTHKWSCAKEMLQSRSFHAVTSVPASMFDCVL